MTEKNKILFQGVNSSLEFYPATEQLIIGVKISELAQVYHYSNIYAYTSNRRPMVTLYDCSNHDDISLDIEENRENGITLEMVSLTTTRKDKSATITKHFIDNHYKLFKILMKAVQAANIQARGAMPTETDCMGKKEKEKMHIAVSQRGSECTIEYGAARWKFNTEKEVFYDRLSPTMPAQLSADRLCRQNALTPAHMC